MLKIQVNETINRNKKYIIYNDMEYAIDFDLLVKNCDYFYKNRKQFENDEKIYLVNHIDDTIELSDGAIENFIKLSQNEECEIEFSFSSINGIQYLSEKFEFQKLTIMLDQIIENNNDEHALDNLLLKISKQKSTNFIDTTKEEQIVSKNLQKLFNNDEIFALSIPMLDRIIKNYLNENEGQIDLNKLASFLFRVLDKKGRNASILFNHLDFKKTKIDIINRLVNEYLEVFDFNMINLKLAQYTIELTKEMNKIKEEYSESILKIKEELENKSKEIEKMIEIEKQNEKQIFEEKEEMKKKYLNDINKMKNDTKFLIDSIESRYNLIVGKNDKNIDKSLMKKYQNLIFETMDFQFFNQLSEGSKEFIISEIVRHENEIKINDRNRMIIEKVLINKHLCGKKDNNQLISEINENINNDHISLFKENAEYLYSQNSLLSTINNIMKYYDNLIIEIQYPSNSYDEILVNITDEKNKYENDKKNIAIHLYINENSFFDKYQQSNSNIDIIEINGKIKDVKKKAFFQYVNTKNIIIQENILTIGISSFEKCTALKSITIPSSVTSIGSNAFKECSSLTQVSIPSSVTSIGEFAFYGCSSLTQISIPSSVTSIGEFAFYGCSSLTQISIPSSVTSIGNCTFFKCSSLTQISIPSSVTEIGWGNFSRCLSLTQITIPPNITSIRADTFCKCSSLAQISIPSSVTSIKKHAFFSCSSLTKISIPSSVTEIGEGAFKRCSSLTQVSLPSSIQIDEKSVFPPNIEILKI